MKNIKKVWIVGAEGRLGREITALIDKREVEVLTTDLDDVDITDTQSVIRFGDMNRPDVIINCAGLTSLELCEQYPEKAYKVNALGARNISISARKTGARLVHISTDDVFDGESSSAYNEFDLPSPQTIYGKSKFAGEQFVKEFGHKYMIIRSSWIYGKGDNFVNQILALADQQDKIMVPDDQFACPTSAKELAKLVIYLMNTADYGVYHGACEGSCSRYELAKEVVRLAGKKVHIEGCCTELGHQVGARPAFTVLDNFMLRISGGYTMPHWKEALAEYIKNHTK
ncbi:MAG: dTDP-4-dehydrorhamnose reductase [Cellulosilyticaceae bacterium]